MAISGRRDEADLVSGDLKNDSSIDRKNQNSAQQAVWCQRESLYPPLLDPVLQVKKEKRRAPHLYPLPLTMGERGIYLSEI